MSQQRASKLGLLFNANGGVNIFLRNVDEFLPNSMSLHPSMQYCSAWILLKALNNFDAESDHFKFVWRFSKRREVLSRERGINGLRDNGPFYSVIARWKQRAESAQWRDEERFPGREEVYLVCEMPVLNSHSDVLITIWPWRDVRIYARLTRAIWPLEIYSEHKHYDVRGRKLASAGLTHGSHPGGNCFSSNPPHSRSCRFYSNFSVTLFPVHYWCRFRN
jgi:hypothetical protein